ncbi:MAG: TonB-dependent receptor, partial [Pseudomonadota bacterium]
MSTNRIIQSALSLSIVTIMMGTAYAADSQENSSDKRSQSPELAKLQTIVVSAAGYEQDLTKAPASITVISKEELQKREYSDI